MYVARPIPNPMRDCSIAKKWIGLFAVCLVATILATLLSLFVAMQAQAIPAFARKYDVNCTACHTAPPMCMGVRSATGFCITWGW